MKLKFNTLEDGHEQARGFVAALVSIFGPDIIPASYERVGEVERATGPVVINRYEAPAPDGYPTKPQDAIGIDPPAPPSNVLPAAERDADGILWDERIHTSNKSTKQDGTWKRKPGLEDAYFTSVMAELKAANTARTLEAAASMMKPADGATQHVHDEYVVPSPPAPTAAEAFTPPASVVIPAHVPAPPVPPAPSVPTPPPAPTGSLHVPSVGELFQRITPLQAAGKLAGTALNDLIGKAGLKSIGELVAANDAKRAEVWALLDTVQ